MVCDEERSRAVEFLQGGAEDRETVLVRVRRQYRDIGGDGRAEHIVGPAGVADWWRWLGGNLPPGGIDWVSYLVPNCAESVVDDIFILKSVWEVKKTGLIVLTFLSFIVNSSCSVLTIESIDYFPHTDFIPILRALFSSLSYFLFTSLDYLLHLPCFDFCVPHPPSIYGKNIHPFLCELESAWTLAFLMIT